MELFYDIEQNSDEWMRARMGIPTSSAFAKVMAKAGPRGGTSGREYVGRVNYMRQLAAERITGELADAGYTNRNMERGHEREDEARRLYAVLNDVDPVQVGFIRNGNCGCSPDSLLGDDGILEIKDAVPHVQFARFEDGTLPNEYRWQVVGQLLVSERSYVDFMSHCRGLKPLIIRVDADTKLVVGKESKKVSELLVELRAGIDRFCDELEGLIQRYRTW